MSDALPRRIRNRPTWHINRAYGHAHRLLREGFAAAGVRGYDYRLLAALEEFGPASQAELGRRTVIDRSDVVAALNDLEADGLVERAPDPSDRRRNVITITAEGRNRLLALDRVVDEVQEQLLAPLSPREREQLVRLLSRLVEFDARS